MKITVFLLLATVFSAHAKTFSQNVSISMRNASLQKIFKEIKKQTGYNFLYTTEQVSRYGNIDLSVRNASVDQAMNECLKGTGLDYSIIEKTIVIKKRTPEAPVVEAPTVPLTYPVSGKVTDESGNPLPSVSIVVKGTSKGAQTDADGNFTIEIPDNSTKVLQFSYVGMEALEVNVANKKNIIVRLTKKTIQQQDVVVVGYGLQKKVNLTGAITAIDSKQIENRGVANISSILVGQAPGLTVIQSGGAPGRDQGSLNIRGLGNLNGVTSPLIIVDGVPTDDYSQINPNDIANVSILKDAASASIYGLNASNGVILITTKRGTAGKMKVNYNFQAGQSGFVNLPEKVSSYELAVLLNEANANDGAPATFSATDLQKFKTGSDPLTHPNTDWVKKVFSKSGTWLQHDLSLVGGTDNTKYNISLGYLNQDGLMPNTGYKRYNFRTNFDQRISNALTAGFNIAASVREVHDPPTNQGVGGETWYLNQAFALWANDQVKYSDGKWAYPNWSGSNFNPVAYIDPSAGYSKYTDTRLFGSMFAEWKILKGLKLKGIVTNTRDYNYAANLALGADLYHINNATGVIASSPDNINASMPTDPSKQNVSRGFYLRSDLDMQALLNYEASLDKHNFKILLGTESRKINDESDGITRVSLSYPTLSAINAADPTGQSTYGAGTSYKSFSQFGRLNYDYNGKYLAEANLRNDASSRFAIAKRSALFPSFALGWVVSREGFFNVNPKIVSNLKLRASWGKLGNEQIGNYLYLSTFNVGSYYVFNGVRATGANEGALANPGVTWESTTAKNIGVDLAFLQNKLQVSVDVFDRVSKDFLFNNFPAPAILGAAPPVQNAGSIKNSGYEIVAKYNNQAGKIKYYINANIAKVKNKITDLGGTGQPGRQVGDPVNNIYGYVAEGIFQTTAQVSQHANQSAVTGGTPLPGDIIYKDLNGDGKVDPTNDRTNLGSYFPAINYGLNAGLDYKGFDFSMVWQGVGQVKGIIAGRLAQPFWLGGKSPIIEELNRWTPDGKNPNARYPITSANRSYNYVTSSWWVASTAYLKLRNIQLGYSLPTSIINRFKLSKVRFYVSAENLLTISPFKIMDPESITTSDPFFGFGGTGAYPTTKRFLGGIQFSF